ncbi:MAG: FAD-dependent monooxygenase [Thermoproteota archaeon]
MSVRCDALIVGGGPSGLLTGSIISRRGFKTIVLEEHGEIGLPEQCTGLVSWRIGEIPQSIVLNTVETARFHLGEEWFKVHSKKRMLVIDRAGYDKHLADDALSNDVEIRLRERMLGIKEGVVLTSRNKLYHGRILVGADGPNSMVAKWSGLKQPGNVLYGVQYVAKGIFEQSTVELFFNHAFSNGGFAWVVPLDSSRARIGLLTRDNPLPRIRVFTRKLGVEVDEKSFTGDSIRFGVMDRTVADGTVLVGDAACQVKPLSLGGLVYSRICSRVAGEACVEALERNLFSKSFLAEKYDLEWRREIRRALNTGLLMRILFNYLRKTSLSFSLIRRTGIGFLAGFIMDPDFLGRFRFQLFSQQI